MRDFEYRGFRVLREKYREARGVSSVYAVEFDPVGYYGFYVHADGSLRCICKDCWHKTVDDVLKAIDKHHDAPPKLISPTPNSHDKINSATAIPKKLTTDDGRKVHIGSWRPTVEFDGDSPLWIDARLYIEE